MSNASALERARSMIGKGTYWLGCGQYKPSEPDALFTPNPSGQPSADCSRFVCWCHQIEPHQPGLNHGPWATVADDINTDLMIEDALHKRQLFEPVIDTPTPGDIIVYHSIWQDAVSINDTGHGDRRWIGHTGIIASVPAVWIAGELHALGIIHCHGPSRLTPCISLSDGSIWQHHNALWNDDGKHPQRASMIVRVRAQHV